MRTSKNSPLDPVWFSLALCIPAQLLGEDLQDPPVDIFTLPKLCEWHGDHWLPPSWLWYPPLATSVSLKRNLAHVPYALRQKSVLEETLLLADPTQRGSALEPPFREDERKSDCTCLKGP